MSDTVIDTFQRSETSSLAWSRSLLALKDLGDGWRRSWLWLALARQDIRLKYRGSLLGPLWLTISTGIMIGSMGFLYAKIFNSDPATYLPFLTVGMVMWNFIAGLITEGCMTFTGAGNVVHAVPLPYSIHVYRLITRNVIVLAHNVLIFPVVLSLFKVVPNADVLLIPIALVLLIINGVWLSFLFGMISARFRDVPPIVASFVQVVFFVTPVFFTPGALGRWAFVGQLNPFFAAIDIVRAPIMGQPFAPYSWSIVLCVTVLGSLGTFLVFARFRSRIPFWVS